MSLAGFTTMSDFIRVEQLCRRFDLSDPWLVRMIYRKPKRFLDAVDNVSFAIERGKTYALVGESGSGKSTIARIAVGLLGPSSGRILIDGHNLHDRGLSQAEHRRIRQRLQMVFQSPYASLNPRWRVGNILAEPLRTFSLVDGRQAEQRRVNELLEQVGIDVVRSATGAAIRAVERLINRADRDIMAEFDHGEERVLRLRIPEGLPPTELHRLRAPVAAIVGAVLREDRVIIPQGKDVIQGGDDILVFCTAEDSEATHQFFATFEAETAE